MYSNLRCLKTSGGSCVFLIGLCELLAINIPDISSLFVLLLNFICDSLWLQLLPLRVTALLTSNSIGQCYPLFCILYRWDHMVWMHLAQYFCEPCTVAWGCRLLILIAVYYLIVWRHHNLSILLLMGIWVVFSLGLVFSFGLLWIVLLWATWLFLRI